MRIMEMNDVLSAMRILCKHPLFDACDNSLRAEPGQKMKWFGVPMGSGDPLENAVFGLWKHASEDQLRKGWKVMREEGLLPSLIDERGNRSRYGGWRETLPLFKSKA